MDSMRRFATVLVALTLAAGCAGGDAADDADATMESATADTAGAATGTEVTDTYAPSLNVDLSAMTRHPSGLYTQDLAEGEGEAVQEGQIASMRYTGWLADGTEFDSGLYDVTLGAGSVIQGWEQGIAGMQPGGRRRLVIPPALGYGEGGYPGAIPPNATLVFDVELVEIK